MSPIRISLTIWRNTLPPFSGSESNPSLAYYPLLAGYLLGLLSNPENGNNMFI
jgi:hypothetical protein